MITVHVEETGLHPDNVVSTIRFVLRECVKLDSKIWIEEREAEKELDLGLKHLFFRRFGYQQARFVRKKVRHIII